MNTCRCLWLVVAVRQFVGGGVALQVATPLTVVLGAFWGLLGSFIDSILGATVQYSGYCSERKKVGSSACGYLRFPSSRFHVQAWSQWPWLCIATDRW